MSVQTQIERLTKAKSDLKTAIANKGVTVPDSALLDSYPGYVDDIQTGGDVQERKTLSVTANGSYSISPDDGYDGIAGADVTVSVPEKSVQEMKVAYVTRNGTSLVSPSTGYDAMKEVSVITSVPFKTQEKTITATENGTYEITPDTNYDGLSKATVSVNVPTGGGSETFIVPPYFSFDGDTTITELDVTNWDMSRWKGCIDNETASLWLGLFSNCGNLTTVKGALGACKPLDLNNAFGKASKLTDLDLSKWDTSACVNMNSVFDGCTSLTGLTGVEGWDTSSVTTMAYMFRNCTGLTGTLDLSGWDVSKLKYMSNMLQNVRINGLSIKGWDLSALSSTTGFLGSSSNSTITKIDARGVKYPNSASFFYYNYTALSELLLADGDTSNVTSMTSMFSSCSSLTTLDLSNFNTSNVTDMSGMFSSCSRLTTLDLSGFNTSNVTRMNNMFFNSTGLTSLDLSSFDTSNVTNMHNMFSICTSLTTLDISNFDMGSITFTDPMFSNCGSLTTVKVTNCNEDTQNKILSQLKTDLSSYTWTLSDGTITRS